MGEKMNHEQVMRQAMEALDGTEALLISMDVTHLLIYEEVAKAITALRSALAEPVQERRSDFERGFQRGWQRAMRDRDRDFAIRVKVEDELAATVARLAKPVQEPVAVLLEYANGERELRFKNNGWDAKETPLYTAPPHRQPLTDEEIADMWVGILYDTPPSGVHDDGLVPHRLARAVERAHGIGE